MISSKIIMWKAIFERYSLYVKICIQNKNCKNNTKSLTLHLSFRNPFSSPAGIHPKTYKNNKDGKIISRVYKYLQLTLTYSKWTIVAIEKGAKYVQSQWRRSGVFINFGQVNVSWVVIIS